MAVGIGSISKSQLEPLRSLRQELQAQVRWSCDCVELVLLVELKDRFSDMQPELLSGSSFLGGVRFWLSKHFLVLIPCQAV